MMQLGIKGRVTISDLSGLIRSYNIKARELSSISYSTGELGVAGIAITKVFVCKPVVQRLRLVTPS